MYDMTHYSLKNVPWLFIFLFINIMIETVIYKIDIIPLPFSNY